MVPALRRQDGRAEVSTSYGAMKRTGTKLRTRKITREPMNGGKHCDVTVETTACNTMSCDRNCRLQEFSCATGALLRVKQNV